LGATVYVEKISAEKKIVTEIVSSSRKEREKGRTSGGVKNG